MEKRLLEILKYYNYSSSTFAEKIGVQRSSISHLLSGRNKPSFDFIARLTEKFPEINIEWFINGKGNMLKKISPGFQQKTLFNSDYDQTKQETRIIEKESRINKVTNVNINTDQKTNSVLKIVLFYKDRTWQEFLPSDS